VITRLATRADIPALTTLTMAVDLSQRDWAGPVPVPSAEECALEWELRFARKDADVRLAEEHGALLGVVAWAAATVLRGGRELVPGLTHVSAVFVDPPHWRRGIARGLLAEAEDAMRAAGYERSQLWTLAGSPAEHLYTALGWRPDGRREPYPPMGLETVAYAKDL